MFLTTITKRCQSLLILASILMISSCAVKAPIINTCPVDKIPVIAQPPLEALKGYQKLKPGKQEIVVPKPWGAFFPPKEFSDADLKVNVGNHYAKTLSEQIKKHNGTIDKWKEDMAKSKKKGWW